MNNFTDKQDLINIIHRCNSPETQEKWLLEMSAKGYECMESECTSCIIAETCLKVFNNHFPTPECASCAGGEMNSGYDLKCNSRCTILAEYK